MLLEGASWEKSDTEQNISEQMDPSASVEKLATKKNLVLNKWF